MTHCGDKQHIKNLAIMDGCGDKDDTVNKSGRSVLCSYNTSSISHFDKLSDSKNKVSQQPSSPKAALPISNWNTIIAHKSLEVQSMFTLEEGVISPTTKLAHHGHTSTDENLRVMKCKTTCVGPKLRFSDYKEIALYVCLPLLKVIIARSLIYLPFFTMCQLIYIVKFAVLRYVT